MSKEIAVTDSWEDIDETELEKRLEEEKQERIRKEQEMATKQNGLSILSNGNDDFRPRILQRPKPAVTILKRPDSSPALSSTSQQNSKPQMKTLEQREKEYAEARLRILGSSAASDESPTEQSKQIINTSSSNYSPNNINQSQQQKSPENVVRLPKGPIPGQGFNIRR